MDGLFEGEGVSIADEMAMLPMRGWSEVSDGAFVARPEGAMPALEDWHQLIESGDGVVLLDDAFLLTVPGKSGEGDIGPLFTDGEVDLGEIVVTGELPDDIGGYTGSGGRGGEPPSDHPSIEDDANEPVDTFDDCLDRSADTVADAVNRIINSMPDKDRIEYGALIWRDANGQLHHTAVTAGNNGVWIPPAAPTGNGFESWSQVVGYVHSHPTQVWQNGNWVSVAPESHFERPSSGDYVTADFYTSQTASRENFTIYVSYAGQVYEYDLRSNATESRDMTGGSAGHGTASGDYRPGTACQ